MAITRRDPFRDLLDLQNGMTRLFGRAYGEDIDGTRSWAPPIDIYETPEAYRVVADFHRVERRFGTFRRIVSLPQQVEADKVEANFDKGVLTVSIPKAVQARPRRIEIKARS